MNTKQENIKRISSQKTLDRTGLRQTEFFEQIFDFARIVQMIVAGTLSMPNFPTGIQRLLY